MFGYVRIAEDELRVKELKRYKSHYCALCKSIACYSQVSRMMLSYDMVFLSILIESDETKDYRCNRKRLKHCRKECVDDKTKYIAAISVILQYYKIQNDLLDGEKRKRLVLNAISFGYNKARDDYPVIDNCVKTSMDKLYSLEQERCSDLIMLENCFTSMFYDFFQRFEKRDELSKVKGELASHVAAWVYWFDMYIDMEKDRSSGDFNAILLQKDLSKGKAWVWDRMLYHLESAEQLLNVLPNSDNTGIIRNVLEIGLPLQMSKYTLENS